MIKRLKKHILTLPQKIELVVLYGTIMFALGIGAKYIMTPDYPDYYDIEEIGVPIDGAVDLDANYRLATTQDKAVSDELSETIEDVITLSQLPSELPAAGVDDVVIVKKEEPIIKTPNIVNLPTESKQEILPLKLDKPVEDSDPPKQSEVIYDYVVAKGDTLSRLLTRAGVDKEDIFHIAKALRKVYNLRNLMVGQKIKITFREKIAGDLEFVVLAILEKDRNIYVVKQDDNNYSATIEDKELRKELIHSKGVISSSLFGLGDKLNIPLKIMHDFIRYYSFDVDFQRDIRKGNEFEVYYEVYYDEDGNKIKDGNVIYGLLTVDDRAVEIYRYSPTGKQKDVDYYTAEGKTLRRSLMKTPINGAVISSPYGNRRHPILGYSKVHKGVDFAAPRGTPFYAGGDGKIVSIGRNGGYGNYLRIRHSAEYETAYGHISKFAKGIKKGRKVKQGQVVAYVGSTGRSTGPHLHYEVLKNGKHINPMKVKIPPGKQLKGSELSNFKLEKNMLDKQLKIAVKR